MALGVIFVEHHPAILGAVRFLGGQGIQKMLGDRFTLTIRVGRQINVGGTLQRLSGDRRSP